MDNAERTAIIGTIRMAQHDATNAIARRETSLSCLRPLKERCDEQYLIADRLCVLCNGDPVAVGYRERLGVLRVILTAWVGQGE